MSYEGYEEGLCENGHYHSWDCYGDPPATCDVAMGKDTVCGKELVWCNSVDQTNGDGEDQKAMLEVLEEAKTETCPTCHHTEVVAVIRYKIPENCGRKGKPEMHDVWGFCYPDPDMAE